MIEITDKKGQKYFIPNKEEIAVILERDKGAQIRLRAGYAIDMGLKEWERIKKEISTPKQTTPYATGQPLNNSVKKNGIKARSAKKDGR